MQPRPPHASWGGRQPACRLLQARLLLAKPRDCPPGSTAAGLVCVRAGTGAPPARGHNISSSALRPFSTCRTCKTSDFTPYQCRVPCVQASHPCELIWDPADRPQPGLRSDSRRSSPAGDNTGAKSGNSGGGDGSGMHTPNGGGSAAGSGPETPVSPTSLSAVSERTLAGALCFPVNCLHVLRCAGFAGWNLLRWSKGILHRRHVLHARY